MPILDIQKRSRQLGEIRIGHVVRSGSKPHPEKLDRFRLTSPSRPLLEQVAALYGGNVAEWTPANGGSQEWEVITKANRLPILLPPQSVSQWYELYRGSLCERRCDGVTEQKSDAPCMCDPENRECAITTRLNVVLRDVPGIGLWLLTTRGFYAATELPPVAEFVAHATGYVNAFLGLEERVVKRPGGTRRFIVPTIEVDVTPAELMAGHGGALAIGDGTATVEASSPAALPAGASHRTEDDWLSLLADTTTVVETRAIWTEASHAGVLTDTLAAAIKSRAAQITGAGAPPATLPQDMDALWQLIVAACPVGWSLDDLELRFAEANDGTKPGAAEPAQLQAFLNDLTGVPA